MTTTDELNRAEVERAVRARRPAPLCEVCHRPLRGADLGDGAMTPADCCERTGLCVECRQPGEHECDPTPRVT